MLLEGEYFMAKTVLLVDDAAFMRMMLKKMLVKEGFEVIGEAENGKEAIEAYKELTPDLVILDITMPIMDGIEALKGIKIENPKANVVMCSAMGQQAMVMEAIKNGAKDFIVKPFKSDRVIESLNKALGI
jgi:two-component system chemotaxis response regulator CheY